MAMIDYGAIVIKNGKVINQNEMFPDMMNCVGWEMMTLVIIILLMQATKSLHCVFIELIFIVWKWWIGFSDKFAYVGFFYG